MALMIRPYHDAGDYWSVRAFLRELLPLNDGRERSWHVYRWDYCRWHVWENIVRQPLDRLAIVWQDHGRMVALANCEDPDHVFLQVHPAVRSAELEHDMLAVAEDRLAICTPDGAHQLRVWANHNDALRQAVLRDRGYQQDDWIEYQRRRSLMTPIADVPIAPGFTVRALGDAAELPARSWASWRAFHPAEPNDRYEGWEWYRNVQRAPLYRRDLDMVAVAPDGTIASFCTIWFDDVTRSGAFEPVGTAPEYQRLGLGKAVMTEGLRRLAWLGATTAYVASSGAGGHALYASVGFTDVETHAPWSRTWS